jgi:hypothetical protein
MPPVRPAGVAIADCGLELVARAGIEAIAELFEPAASPCARAVALWGPRGSGLRSAVAELARAARIQGAVPVAADLVNGRFAPLFEAHTLFVIEWTAAAGWPSLLDAVIRSPRPHVLLVVGNHEIDGVDSVPLEAIASDALAKAVRPVELPELVDGRVRRAAARARGLPGLFADALWGAKAANSARRVWQRAGTRAAEVPAVYGAEPD